MQHPEEISRDVAHMTDRLRRLQAGLAVVGVRALFVERVIDKLVAQDKAIARFRSDRAYTVGFTDGWDAAMATGLPGDDREEA